MGITEAEFEQIIANQRAANPMEEALLRYSPSLLTAEGKKLRAKLLRERKSEAELERTCTNILIQDGWRALKTNPVSRRAHGKGFGEKGMADYLYIRYLDKAQLQYPGGRMVLKSPAAEVLWVEYKTPSGEVAQHQRDWHCKEIQLGALVVVAMLDFEPTVEGFIAWYEASGLKRARR